MNRVSAFQNYHNFYDAIVEMKRVNENSEPIQSEEIKVSQYKGSKWNWANRKRVNKISDSVSVMASY